MTDVSGMRQVLAPSRFALPFVWFSRAVAASCLVFGISYWIRLIGLEPGPISRFDLMPVPWQIASVALAAFYPVAGVGLWMLTSWGPVIWLICAATESVMYGVFPEIFGMQWTLLASHAVVAVLLLGLRVAIMIEKRRARA